LVPDASLEEIEPKAKELWPDPRTRMSAAELVLGRRIDGAEPGSNPLLGSVLSITEPDKAFGTLLLLKDMEDRQAEQIEQ